MKLGDLVDMATGEVLDASAIMEMADRLRRTTRQRSPFGRQWVKMAKLAVVDIANLGLTALEMRVLLYLISTMHDGNVVEVNQATIAKELSTYQSNVSLALKQLVECFVLERVDGVIGSRFTVYRISARIAWFGADEGADNVAHMAAYRGAPKLEAVKEALKTSKVDRALRKIAKAAKHPMHLQTASTLPAPMATEATWTRDEYSQA